MIKVVMRGGSEQEQVGIDAVGCGLQPRPDRCRVFTQQSRVAAAQLELLRERMSASLGASSSSSSPSSSRPSAEMTLTCTRVRASGRRGEPAGECDGAAIVLIAFDADQTLSYMVSLSSPRWWVRRCRSRGPRR
jgi:hypothetical protein